MKLSPLTWDIIISPAHANASIHQVNLNADAYQWTFRNERFGGWPRIPECIHFAVDKSVQERKACPGIKLSDDACQASLKIWINRDND